MLANLVDGNDVRMIDSSRRLGFDMETMDDRSRRQLPRSDHLYGHDSIQTQLPSLEDRAHPAARNFFQQFVIAKVTQPRPSRGRQSLATSGRSGAGRFVSVTRLRRDKQALGTKPLP